MARFSPPYCCPPQPPCKKQKCPFYPRVARVLPVFFPLTLSFWGRLLRPSQPPAKLATSLLRKEGEMHKYVDLCYMIKHLIVFPRDYPYHFLFITPFFHNIQPLTRKMNKPTSSHIKISTVIPQSPRLCCKGHACAKKNGPPTTQKAWESNQGWDKATVQQPHQAHNSISHSSPATLSPSLHSLEVNFPGWGSNIYTFLSAF